jgi:hypothetical protein
MLGKMKPRNWPVCSAVTPVIQDEPTGKRTGERKKQCERQGTTHVGIDGNRRGRASERRTSATRRARAGARQGKTEERVRSAQAWDAGPGHTGQLHRIAADGKNGRRWAGWSDQAGGRLDRPDSLFFLLFSFFLPRFFFFSFSFSFSSFFRFHLFLL